MKKSEEIIKEEFQMDIPLPESLSKNSIIKMLEENNTEPEKAKIKLFPKILSVAAMLTIIIVAAISINLQSEFVPLEQEGTSQADISATDAQPNNEATETTVQAINPPAVSNLKVAKSEKDLKNHFVKMYAEGKIDDCIDVVFNYASNIFYTFTEGDKSADMAVSESNMMPTMAATAANPATGSVPHGTTNIQVADVDEGDIIKNDGRYLYIVNSPGESVSKANAVTIVDTQSMNTVYKGKIELKDSEVLEEIKKDERKPDFGTDMVIRDIYLKDNTLTVICTYGEKIYAVIYDITEKHAPKEVRRFDQDGTYVSSRMVDGVLYTVSNYAVRGSSAEEVENNAIPEVDCDCIHYSRCYMIDDDSTNYIVVSAFDTSKPDSKTEAISVLGGGFEIYSTSKNLYVYSVNYDNRNEENPIAETIVNSFSLNGTSISHKATGTFKGTCINQYSFDEYQGNLRVAACYYDYRTNEDVSCVYVLNEDLEIIGELKDIAKDEQVKAVRFMGDTGYVVTFRNTDPLFIIDFSVPEKPEIKGELKIPGYSTYLHPVADGYLVGIGYDGTDENAIFDSVKVSLFDVRDKSNPVEADTFVIKEAYSLVNDNPKAFFFYSERNMLGIPVSHQRDGTTVKSIQTLTVNNGKLSDNLGYIHYSSGGNNSYYYVYDELFRGTYIGNLLYTIDNNEIIEHNLDSGERVRSCTISSRENMKINVVTTNDAFTSTTTPVK